MLCTQETAQILWDPSQIAADDGVLKPPIVVTQGATTNFKSSETGWLLAPIWNDINISLMEVWLLAVYSLLPWPCVVPLCCKMSV